MKLRAFLQEIAANYDRHAGVSAPAQVLLRRADKELAQYVPGGILVRGRGGQTQPTLTPFVAFLDPDETTKPTDGVYVVYLFTEDLENVALSLMQGIATLAREMGHAAARQQLAQDGSTIREALAADLLLGLDAHIDLRSTGVRQRGYEAGNIAAITYKAEDLPSEPKMIADLSRMLTLYQEAVGAKRTLLQASPGSIASSSVLQTTPGTDPLHHFIPKDDSDYVAHLIGKKLIKTRRHETLVRQFGELAQKRGFHASTAEHPRDLVLRREDQEWLAEVKVVYQGNVTEAVRAALGQLYSYRHFLYQSPASPRLLGVFSEEIGNASLTSWRHVESAPYGRMRKAGEVPSRPRPMGSWASVAPSDQLYPQATQAPLADRGTRGRTMLQFPRARNLSPASGKIGEGPGRRGVMIGNAHAGRASLEERPSELHGVDRAAGPALLRPEPFR